MDDTKASGFSYRPKKDHARRLNDLIEATEHKKAHFLDKALDISLPALEKRYASELAEYRAHRRTVYPPPTPDSLQMNDAVSSGASGNRDKAGERAAVAELQGDAGAKVRARGRRAVPKPAPAQKPGAKR